MPPRNVLNNHYPARDRIWWFLACSLLTAPKFPSLMCKTTAIFSFFLFQAIIVTSFLKILGGTHAGGGGGESQGSA